MDKSIYDLEFEEVLTITLYDDQQVDILRVPGGWIYNYMGGNSVFVPYDSEFKGKNV